MSETFVMMSLLIQQCCFYDVTFCVRIPTHTHTHTQAYYRGYRLRRRLCAVLERAHHTEVTEREEDEEEVDYEEEIKLDYLDEVGGRE